MKKTLRRSAIMIGTAALFALPMTAGAKIVGNCSDCHTMHNSEEGQAVASAWDPATGSMSTTATPNGVLLKYDCVSCHAQGGAPVVDMAGGSKIPQVYGTFVNDLAGGNFAYIDGTKGSGASDRKGHNVTDIVPEDGTLLQPPGYSRGPQIDTKAETAPHEFEMASVFTCAGKAGCHGVRNQLVTFTEDTYANGVVITAWHAPQHVAGSDVYRKGVASLKGAHHYDATGTLDVADDVYNSYRFLLGTKGIEVSDWTNTNASHNVYYGIDGNNFLDNTAAGCDRCHFNGHGADTDSYVKNVSGTMTNFCETCHSNFHSAAVAGNDAATPGAFLRHPSDYAIQAKTEYSAITTWSVDTPVAASDLSTGSTTDTAAGPGNNQDIVMCLSCHMSHASNYDHMLRWDYTQIKAGAGASNVGCFQCHTTKDTGDATDVTWTNPMIQ